MNEIQRLSYLDAMGIGSYVSRRQLPAAAPTRRLRIRRASESTEAEPVPAATSGLDGVRSSLETVSAPAPAEIPAPAVAPAVAADVPVFSLAAALVGNWLWLEEIPRGREPGREYLQLLHGICKAMDWEAGEPRLELFNWPLNNSAQLDHGEEAARHGVSGFVQARLDRNSPAGVVLLGDWDAAWFDRGLVAQQRLLELPSAWQMLRQPMLKQQAWQVLKTLRDG